jgi:hypothetical protein
MLLDLISPLALPLKRKLSLRPSCLNSKITLKTAKRKREARKRKRRHENKYYFINYHVLQYISIFL